MGWRRELFVVKQNIYCSSDREQPLGKKRVKSLVLIVMRETCSTASVLNATFPVTAVLFFWSNSIKLKKLKPFI